MLRKMFAHRAIRAALVVAIVAVSGTLLPTSALAADNTTISPTTNPTFWDLPGITVGGPVTIDGVKITDVKDDTGKTVQTRPTNEELCGQSECTWTDVFPDWVKAPFRWIATGLASGFGFTLDKTKAAWTWLTWDADFSWVDEPHLDNTTFTQPSVVATVHVPASPDQFGLAFRACWAANFNYLPQCANTQTTQAGGVYLVRFADVVYPACQSTNMTGCGHLWIEYITGGNNSGTSTDRSNGANWIRALDFGDPYANTNVRPKQATTATPVTGATTTPKVDQKIRFVVKTTCVDSAGLTQVVTTTVLLPLSSLSAGSTQNITVPKCPTGKKPGGVAVEVPEKPAGGGSTTVVTTTNNYTTNNYTTNEYVTIQKKEGDSWVWCAQGANCSTVSTTNIQEGIQYRCVAQDGTVVEGENCVEIVKRLNEGLQGGVVTPPSSVQETCFVDFNCWKQQVKESVLWVPFQVYDDFLTPEGWSTARDFSQPGTCEGIGFEIDTVDLISPSLYEHYPYLPPNAVQQAYRDGGDMFDEKPTVHPFSVCSERVRNIANIVRTFQAGVLYVGAAWYISRKLFQVMGMSELTEDGKGSKGTGIKKRGGK